MTPQRVRQRPLSDLTEPMQLRKLLVAVNDDGSSRGARMDQQVQKELDQKLRQQWNSLYPAILAQFTTVAKADLDSATSVSDIVSRIADRSRFSERYVENRLHELVTTGGANPTQQFGSSAGSTYGQQQ